MTPEEDCAFYQAWKTAADGDEAPPPAHNRLKPSASRDLSNAFFSQFEDEIQDVVEPIMTFASVRRDNIRENVVGQIKKTFPVMAGEYEVHLEDAWVDEQEATPTMERKARLEGSSLLERVVGNIVIKDKDGKVVDSQKNYTLAKLPYFTDDHAFIIEGTPYAPKNQLRTRSGVFTRRRGNEDIEASFNLSKGANFRIALTPESGIFNMEFGTTSIPLYPILRAMGYTHDAISRDWGKDLARMNEATDKKRDVAVNKLYEKVIPSFNRTSTSNDAKIKEIKQYFDKTEMDGDVNRRTLGESFTKLSPEALISASKRLLGVYKSGEDTDDRDSLAYQKIVGIEDFLAEKIKLDSKDLSNKIKTKIRFPKQGGVTVKNIMPPNVFGRGIQNFITTSSVVSTPTGINPLERLDSMGTITRLGEGAISSERAIPMDSRRLHHTHLGVLGPLRTPESSRAGIDVRSAMYAAKDKNGHLYTPLKNLKTGKIEYKKVDEIDTIAVAFPEQDVTKGNVDCLLNGKTIKLKPDQVMYQVPSSHSMYSIGENMIPMLEGIQGNRGIMASKMVTQAMPLVDAEEPYVQASAPNSKLFGSMEEHAATVIESISPTDGVVTKIDQDYVYIKADKDGKEYKVPYQQNVPYSKTRFHQEVIVKVGDKVKPMQHLTKSNFTRNGKLTLGRNMTTAYIADEGYNSDDAITISETAANKLTSEHMYTYKLALDSSVKMGKEAHASHIPNKFTKENYKHLDQRGVVAKGAKLKYGDVIIAAVRKTEPSAEDLQLGMLHKSLMKTYADAAVSWEKYVEGEVIDVIVTPSAVTITVMSKEPAKIGDKIAGTYGNKGVIGRIVKDADMLQNEAGKPVDILFTSAGVISRINPSQIVASALGKAAKILGKPYIVKNFNKDVKNNVEFARQALRDAGYTDPKHLNGKEDLKDPITGRVIPNIFVGENYILKLFKTTDSNFAARSTGGYDSLDQPTKGGDKASKSTGNLEINSLLAHNARNYLSDIANIKSNKNGDYWRAVQLGLPTPTPAKNVAFNKFTGMLKASGINVLEKPDSLVMAPMTDEDVMKMSNGEIENEKRVRSKDLKPEKGGLFDEAVTGGLTGTKWGHISLPEPTVNPVFFEPARRLLGKTKEEMENLIKTQDGNKLRETLNSIDVKSELVKLKEEIVSKRGVARDDLLKRIKYLEVLASNEKKPGEAYMLSKVPVLPPSMRPLLPAGNNNGTLIVDDANFLYRDLLLGKRKFEELREIPGMPDEYIEAERKQVYDGLKAITGLGDAISPQSSSRKAKGFIANIAGVNPKYGFFQKKIIKRRMDLSGSGTVALNPTLGVDDVEVPEEQGWVMYQPFIIKRLVEQGMGKQDALQNWEDRSDIAREALLEEAKDRPMTLNRAPSLHRWNVLGVKPKFVQGKTIRVNPFLTGPQNMDFDGDVAILSVPATDAGKRDVKNMMLSKNLFSDKRRGDLLVSPVQESIIGWTKATEAKPKHPGKVFKYITIGEAIAAYKRGDLGEGDLVEIAEVERNAHK
jgi:DNA-directed RNA polymerase beta subunit